MRISTLTLLPVLKWHGFVVDQADCGVAGILVLMGRIGDGNAGPVDQTKPAGSFEPKLSRILESNGGARLVITVDVVAFGPKSDQAAMVSVSVIDGDANQRARLEVIPESPGR